MAPFSTWGGRRRWLSVLVGAAVLAASGGPAGGGKEGLVYYQVVYTNRKIRDLTNVPTTNQGIRRVIRISRVDGPVAGSAVHVVDAYGVDYAELGRTVRKELRWDGKAWVLPQARRGPPTTRPAPESQVTLEQKRKILAALAVVLAEQRRDLTVAEQAVGRAAELLNQAKGSDRQRPASVLLDKARAHRQEMLERTLRIEAVISMLNGRPVAAGGAAATATSGPGAPAGAVLAPPGPITARRVLPHRLQVWKLPPGRGVRSYRVSMAHAEAGRLGGFHYVAYADTDGDGRPDTLIARSPLVVADRPGGWTRWSFTTDHKMVFAGNTWRRADAVQYYRRGRADTGVAGTEVFVSGSPRGVPRHQWTYPYFGNIYVRVGGQNPE